MASSRKKSKNRTDSAKHSAGASRQQPLREQSVFAHFKKEIWGIVCALLAILVVLSGLDRDSVMARFFLGLVGEIGLFVFPVGLVLCAIALIANAGRSVAMRVFCSLSFAFLVSALAHLVMDASKAEWGVEMIGVLYEEGARGVSGGVIGGLLAMLFCLPGGKPVAVRKAVIGKVGGGAGVYAFPVDLIVVEHQHHVVGGDVDIALTAPEAIVLGSLERCDGILGKTGSFAVPEATVGYNSGFTVLIYLRKTGLISGAGCQGQQRRCCDDC